jgi:adapter protein MecA 1/2
MEIEILNNRQIRATITKEDLIAKGINVQYLMSARSDMHGLFTDILEQAEDELDFIARGPISVEMFVSPQSSIVMIITKQGDDSADVDYEDGECTCGGLICGRKPADPAPVEEDPINAEYMLYRYGDIEHVIQVAHRLHYHDIAVGSLYHYNNLYYLALPLSKLGDHQSADIQAIMSEYGQKSKTTIHMLEVYGKPIFTENAVRNISRNFC